jgi:hypothetical protein
MQREYSNNTQLGGTKAYAPGLAVIRNRAKSKGTNHRSVAALRPLIGIKIRA